jgi:hypothetical protein
VQTKKTVFKNLIRNNSIVNKNLAVKIPYSGTRDFHHILINQSYSYGKITGRLIEDE